MRKNGQTSDNLDHFFCGEGHRGKQLFDGSSAVRKGIFFNRTILFSSKKKNPLPHSAALRVLQGHGHRRQQGAEWQEFLFPPTDSLTAIEGGKNFFGICGPQKKIVSPEGRSPGLVHIFT